MPPSRRGGHPCLPIPVCLVRSVSACSRSRSPTISCVDAVAGRGILLQAALNDAIQLGHDSAAALPTSGGGSSSTMRAMVAGMVPAANGLVPEASSYSSRPKREDVSAEIRVLAERLFRREVRRRSDQHAGLRQPASASYSARARPKSSTLMTPARRLDDILRLDVAMDDALGVCFRERSGKLQPDVDHVDDRQRTRFDKRAKRRAGHVLAGHVQLAVDLFERINRGDARMRQRGGHLGFIEKPLTHWR